MKNNFSDILLQNNFNLVNFMQKIVLSMRNIGSTKSSSMENEIFEQPSILKDLISRYITPENYILINLPLNIKKVVLIASGSSYNCAYITAEMLKDIANCDAECVYSSEFEMNKKIPVPDDILYIFISQSGETSDTLHALKQVSGRTDKIFCVTNNEDSTLWQMSNFRMLTYAGKEFSIASTKAMGAQLFCLYLLVLKIMYSKNIDIQPELTHINNLPVFMENLLSDLSQLKQVAKKLAQYNSISILGSREFYAMGKEGALKIKETSYSNTNAYPQGEFMHGHLAVLNQKAALISLIDKRHESLCIKNLKKIKEDYKPYIVTISSCDSDPVLDKLANHNFKLEADSLIFTMFGTLLIMQLLALEIAKKLKKNIDRPIGLRKVVIN